MIVSEPVLTHRPTRAVGIEQAVQVDDEIAHMGVVDSLLRLRLPGAIGAGVIRIDADNLDLVEVLELTAAKLAELAAKDEMQQLFSGYLFGHGLILRRSPGGRWETYAVSWIKLHGLSLCKLAAAVVQQIDQHAMAGTTGGYQRAMHNVRDIVTQQTAGNIGQQAAGFVHQKVGRGKVPVMAARRGQCGIEFPLRDARQPQGERMHFGLRQNTGVKAGEPVEIAFGAGALSALTSRPEARSD